MKVKLGKLHAYLGMTLDYSVKVQVNITILYYIKEMLECFEKTEQKYTGIKPSAAPMNLFVVDEDFDNLRKEKPETFLTFVANILFDAKILIPGTGTSIYYLTTRVREP